MMRRIHLAVLMLSFVWVGQVDAALIFVGQWQVDAGPDWGTNPPVYSGQEAAALLFGGSAGDYTISTVSADPNLANSLAWYSIWGVADGTQAAQNTHIDSGNPGYDDPGGTNTAWSAYVDDHAIGPNYINFAFLEDVAAVPEPASLIAWSVLGLAIGGGCYLRRRKA